MLFCFVYSLIDLLRVLIGNGCERIGLEYELGLELRLEFRLMLGLGLGVANALVCNVLLVGTH